ncbi:altronate dehydratase family protein [Vallitaleaceae bacterium 9-2]
MKNFIQIHGNDNVIIVLEDVVIGESIEHQAIQVTFKDDVKSGHKVALKPIKEGEPIIKYGMPIGKATKAIAVGEHVHTHNVKTQLDDVLEYKYEPHFQDFSTLEKQREVNVYVRPNGEIGIRNELWVIPTVGCVNGVSNQIIQVFKERMLDQGVRIKDLENIDGIFAFGHNYGCSQMGDDHINTRKTLQNIVKHPNAGGVLVVGLGCENNQIDAFERTLGDYNKERVSFLISQEVDDEIEAGVELLTQLFEKMRMDKREPQPISKLRIGLECGGSDGLSGITANPLIGMFSDYLIHHGGTTVLTEVPEMFGAETILMNRCKDEATFEKTVELVNDFKNYYKRHDQVIYENPSPGNKNGGITTLEDKSLGCTQKAGSSQVIDVLKHTERISKHGLNLLSAPGNDAVATTALGMSGCQMVLFSTGRGTPFGGFIPTMKIATNSRLANLKPNWIDFNAGRLVDGETMDALLHDFIEQIIATANGQYVRQEVNNYREIAIFKSGVTL